MKSLPFFKGLSWLILLNLLVKPVWIFFIDRQVQNIVGFDSYGPYFALLNLSYVLFFLADAGLSNMLNQRMAYQQPVNLNQLLRIKFFLLFLYFVACCFIGWLTRISLWQVFIYIILTQVLNSVFVFLRSIVTAHQYFRADAWFSVIDKLLMVILCGSLIYTSFFGTINLLLFLQLQAICTALAICTACIFIARKRILGSGISESNNQVLKLVMPFAACILLMSVHYRLDGFLLERLHFHGAIEAGIYAAAYRLLDAGNMIGYLAASFLVPYLARHQHDRELTEEAVINTRHGLLFFAIGLVCFTIPFAPFLQNLLYHRQDIYATRILQYCIAVLPAYYLVHIYGSLLTARTRFRQFITILAISVVINILINLWLIPAYGALGCCIAALVSQYFCGLACYVIASWDAKISFGLKANFVYLLCAALLCGLFYFGKMAISNVWIILAIAILLTLSLLTTQLGFIKKYFISTR